MNSAPRFAISAVLAMSVLPMASDIGADEPPADAAAECVDAGQDPSPGATGDGPAAADLCDTAPSDEPSLDEAVPEPPVDEVDEDGTVDGDDGNDAGEDAVDGDDPGQDAVDGDDAGEDAVDGDDPGQDAVDGDDPGQDAVDGDDAQEPVIDVPVDGIDEDTALDTNPADETVADETVVDDAVDPAPGLRATTYDGVYAQGVPVWVAMSATRQLESGGNYAAQAWGSTASGAYQVIDSTWNRYGGYARAIDAPPEVQDQFAYESMVTILKRFGNEVSTIPVAWYYPAALRDPSLMDIVPAPYAGNVLTPREYQGRWMAVFHQLLDAGSPVYLPSDTDPLIPAIAFPVLGPTSFWDDWHAPRDGGERRHEGLDFMGEAGQPLRAAFDGIVTRIRPDDVGRAGIGITITRDDGIRANYFHLDAELSWHPALAVGDRVKAGQIVGFMGATGNAGVPHLHFELRTPDGEPIAPYPAALEAVQREQCSVGIGPWATAFQSPTQFAASLAELADAIRAAGPGFVFEVPAPTHVEIPGPGAGDGTWWIVGSDGSVTATGRGALIAPDQGACDRVPVEAYGTGAAGVDVEDLPADWWGDDVDDEQLAAMLDAVAVERSEEFDDPIGSVDDPTTGGPVGTTPSRLRPI